MREKDAELGSYIEFCCEWSMFKVEEVKKLLELYNHTWNTVGALILSLKEKKIDDSWDRSYGTIKEDCEEYDA